MLDNDDDGACGYRSCFTPMDPHLAYYSELALAAGAADEPEGIKTGDDDELSISDNGLPKPLSSSPPPPNSNHGGVQSPSASRSGDSHHGGDLTRIGTSWSQTGDVWWSSAVDDHHEIYYDDSPYDHNYDIYDDQNEGESADGAGGY